MKDLEIRGAGTLLGVRQSGFISAVGFNLYCRLLAEAVAEQKAEKAGVAVTKSRHLPPPTIDLPLSAYIPEEYVPDLDTRLSLYQHLAKLDRAEDIAALADEFGDRFGKVPKEVENLLYAVRIKMLAAKAGIESITTEEGQIVVRLLPGMQLDKQKLAPLLRDGIQPGTNQLRLHPKKLGKEWKEVLEEVVRGIG